MIATEKPPQLELRKEFEDDDLRIESVAGEGVSGVVAFTGVGFELGGLQRAEFVSSASVAGRRPVIFVIDKTRSWFNRPGLFERILDLVNAHFARVGVTQVVTLGNSMGGFGACLFAAPLKARRAIAFTPQWSIRKEIMPEETRWQEWTNAIAEHRFSTAFDNVDPSVHYWICNAFTGSDLAHSRLFPAASNVTHVLIPNAMHGLSAHLKRAGLLNTLVAGLLDEDDTVVSAALSAANAFVQNPRASVARAAEA